jgi:predicted short-subunit dehydrogenase-like oxidoreductase (DUF2520 family)
MHVNLIGPGRVGQALAASLLQTSSYSLMGIYHPNIEQAKKITQQLKQGIPCDTLAALPTADITFITTPDDTIPSLCTQLSNEATLKPESIIAHMSGILDSDVLMPVKKQNVSIGSLHPLKAFRKTHKPEHHAFKNVDCAIEGEARAVTCLTTLAQTLGAHVFDLAPEKKATYHAAAIMASNYLVTLAAASSTLFKEAGIADDDALKLCTRLMQTSLDNLKHVQTPEQALTGPLMRGDINTLKQHLHHIKSPITQTLYQAAGLATLALTTLPCDKIDAIKKCLQDSRPS